MIRRRAARLVVYGDFNCPFSALASARATLILPDGDVSRGLGALARLARFAEDASLDHES